MIFLVLISSLLVFGALGQSFTVTTAYDRPDNHTHCNELEIFCDIVSDQEDASYEVKWIINGEVASVDRQRPVGRTSTRIKCSPENLGNITCSVTSYESKSKNQATSLVEFHTGPQVTGTGDIKPVGSAGAISCQAVGYPVSSFKWFFKDNNFSNDTLGTEILEERSNYWVKQSIVFNSTRRDNNGTYACEVDQEETNIDFLVEDKPDVEISHALGVGGGKLYLNWTVVEWNEKVQSYFVKVMKIGSEVWQQGNKQPIPGNATSFVVVGLEPGATYSVQIEAKNKFGPSVNTLQNPVTTLLQDPTFVPNATTSGGTSSSISTSWTSPPEEWKYLIGYFTLQLRDSVSQEEKQAVVYGQKQHMFEQLKPARNYTFSVKACNIYTKECGTWSDPAIGTTIDGESGPPENVKAICEKGGSRGESDSIHISWNPPLETNGKIIHYQLRLSGQAGFHDQTGIFRREEYGPMTGTSETPGFKFYQVPANTNFSVQVSGTTSSKKSGLIATASCMMPPSSPSLLDLNRIAWSRVKMSTPSDFETFRTAFKVTIPRLSERLGEVCCYRILMLKITEDRKRKGFPEAENLKVGFFKDAEEDKVDAYLAEIVDRGYLNNIILVGDGSTIDKVQRQCNTCRAAALRTSYMEEEEFGNELKRKRYAGGSDQGLLLEDGHLDKDAFYSGVLEVLVRDPSNGRVFSAFSGYFSHLPATNAPGEIVESENMPLIIALIVLSGLAVVLFIFVLALLLLRRYGKRASEGAHENMSLSGTCRFIMRQLRDGRTLLTSQEPLISLSPIKKEDMLAAFLERRKDSDYGFQEEFEMLPDRFPDRTTKATDAFENLSKNRYPDIKAYDQTRVKLHPQLGSTDYINANLVTGYKERKKFICAQGPMESTVQDFWRMIWEQRVEIMVMLTNLEEYNKTKCFRYWPEPELLSAGNSNTIYSVPEPETQNTTPSNGTLDSDHMTIEIEQQNPSSKGREKLYGDVKVLHVKQTKYADYIIRELQVSRPKTPSPRSPSKGSACPIYENTLINEQESEETVELEREVRPVFQYHFNVWKDFQAPEYPSSILKFIKRLHEDYSPERGPILVHCSAGVGRTGSLVAIDSLLQQLNEEGAVSIFNTIADMRHQRNFLVQSLKQYIFVYRALMEHVQFGDTETEVFRLADQLEKLKKEGESGKSPLQEEFERLALVLEERKPCTVSSSDECASRNRNQAVIPYDRNRVILVPVPHKEQSTYINASFIEAYDNRESFIVTQDPLESTMYDFWRMVVGHEISTLVMLSDFEVDDPESNCPRYWPEDNQEVTFECVTVKHTHTSTKPVYIKRDFTVTNSKTREEVNVSQLQYLAWPSDGEVDSVPDPSLVETFVQFALDSLALHERLPNGGPMCVHCSNGSTRSSVLLALCILIQQSRTEGRVDVFNVVRKLRSQRQGIISHYNHYRFLCDAISAYICAYPQDMC